MREEDVQVVEVLPRDEYEWAHLPGAVHLSLKQFSREAALERLDPARPVAVYCNGFL